ncbi:hypothetical protein AB0I82_29065 [Streptomyces sp. NPDC050315]|uniref:hypothetical protein n=1 Tax=Streptomyces sp. NPDC050315 TaxID=3155039 RepID=UPI0034432535
MSGPQVGSDMTVEVALSVMAGARAGHLFLCDDDDQCTGMISRAQLTAVRDSPAYTDQVRLRDVIATGEPFTPSVTTSAGTEHGMSYWQRRGLPLVAERTGVPGAPALFR